MALLGWASFAWQADYGQFYVIDPGDAGFRPPAEITEAMARRRLAALPAGLVVYTAGCLQQHLRIQIHDAEPEHPAAEPESGGAWTQEETIAARFPSRRLTLSSPSAPDPLPGGPFFLLEAEDVVIRVSWMEFQGRRDDTVPVEPDVIVLSLWPAPDPSGSR